MVSVVGREELRSQTLASLSECGINPEVFVSQATPPERKARLAEIRRNVRRALSAGLRSDASHVLYVEDDIVAHPRLREVLHKITDDNLAAFTPYLPGTKSFRPIDLRLGEIFPVANLSQWYGAQCLLMRRDIAQAILALPEDWCADMGLRKILRRKKEKLWSVHPNLVQHREGKSSWLSSGKRHQSGTFLST